MTAAASHPGRKTHANYYGDRSCLEVALSLHAKGYKVFPLGQPERRELDELPPARVKALKVPHSSLAGDGTLERIYAAPQTEADVRAMSWDSYLVAAQMDGKLALDHDRKHGEAYAAALDESLLALPHWAIQRTMSGGQHQVARLPEGTRASSGTLRWHGRKVGETRSGNAYICVYEPDNLPRVADLPEYDPDELPAGLTLTNVGEGTQDSGAAAVSIAGEPVDGAAAAIADLVLNHAPSARHESLVAVLNVAYRLGVLDTAIQILESDDVRVKWCADGSRGAREWEAEIARWVRAIAEKGKGKGYGVPFLESEGFDVTAIAALLGPVRKGGWPEAPASLPPLIPEAPSLPAELIPEAFRGWLTDAAERAGVPLEAVAIPAMSGLSAVVGRQAFIRPKKHDDWTTAPNVWGALIMPPGSLKTPAIAEGLRPLGQLAAAAGADYEAARVEAEASTVVLEAEIAAIKDRITKAAKAGNRADMEAAREELTAKIEEKRDLKVTEHRYMTQDATVEKLGELLQENPRGILVSRDELAGWLKSLDRAGREGDRQFYLEGWSGNGRFTFDRIGRGTVHIEAMCVTVLGGIQPGALRAYIEEAVSDGGGADGLLQRFQLLVWPELPKVFKNVDRVPDRAARDRALRIFQRLDKLDAAAFGTDAGDDTVFRFAPDAQELFDAWREELENRLLSTEVQERPAFASHLAKYRSLMPSLALLFHLVNVAGGEQPGAVTFSAASLAAQWCEFLELHAAKVYAMEGKMNATHRLAERVQEGDVKDEMPVRDVYRAQWRGLHREATVTGAIADLQALGWLRLETLETGGRPKRVVRLHPKLRGS